MAYDKKELAVAKPFIRGVLAVVFRVSTKALWVNCYHEADLVIKKLEEDLDNA